MYNGHRCIILTRSSDAVSRHIHVCTVLERVFFPLPPAHIIRPAKRALDILSSAYRLHTRIASLVEEERQKKNAVIIRVTKNANKRRYGDAVTRTIGRRVLFARRLPRARSLARNRSIDAHAPPHLLLSRLVAQRYLGANRNGQRETAVDDYLLGWGFNDIHIVPTYNTTRGRQIFSYNPGERRR